MNLPEGGRELDEQALAGRARRGDDDAFASLVRRYEETAFRTAYLIVRDDAEAQDVAQEAFVRAHRSLGRFDERRPFRPWLLRIVTNLAFNSVRSARRRGAMAGRYERDEMTPTTEASPESAAVAAERAQRLWQAIGALGENDQEVLYLRYFLDASEEETAEAIGRPAGTVKSRLHRALTKLRRVIETSYPDLSPEAAAYTQRGREA
ncbi:MAG: sigma-70 family RNA polymerase sigma factor [Dehalococcoidia bacterium]